VSSRSLWLREDPLNLSVSAARTSNPSEKGILTGSVSASAEAGEPKEAHVLWATSGSTGAGGKGVGSRETKGDAAWEGHEVGALQQVV